MRKENFSTFRNHENNTKGSSSWRLKACASKNSSFLETNLNSIPDEPSCKIRVQYQHVWTCPGNQDTSTLFKMGNGIGLTIYPDFRFRILYTA